MISMVKMDWYNGETIKDAPRGTYLTCLKGAGRWSRTIIHKMDGQVLLGGGAQVRYFGPVPDPTDVEEKTNVW